VFHFPTCEEDCSTGGVGGGGVGTRGRGAVTMGFGGVGGAYLRGT
jgi:hypothetical protein